MFSVKRTVRKHILCYTFIQKLMNQARLKFCAASSVEWVKLKLKLSEVEVCPIIEIELAIELFNLDTWSFQERYKFICFLLIVSNLAKSCVISFCVKKNKSSSLGRIYILKIVQNHSNSFKCVGITPGKVGIVYEQNRIIMMSSNCGLKIAKKFKL